MTWPFCLVRCLYIRQVQLKRKRVTIRLCLGWDLHHHRNVSLHHQRIVRQHHHMIVSLHHQSTVSLHHHRIVSLRRCVSLIVNNCSSWAAPNVALDKLDACPGKHLRIITEYQWPNSLISNKDLYKMCNTIPLSITVAQIQWSMFGYVLWMPEETLAQKSEEFAVIGSSNYRAWKGHYCKKKKYCLINCEWTSKMQGALRTGKRLKELLLGFKLKKTECWCSKLLQWQNTVKHTEEITYLTPLLHKIRHRVKEISLTHYLPITWGMEELGSRLSQEH